MSNTEETVRTAFWAPDAKVEMTGAEFGALSQLVDLTFNPIGNYSLGDLVTLFALARDARNAVVLRMEDNGQLSSDIESPQISEDGNISTELEVEQAFETEAVTSEPIAQVTEPEVVPAISVADIEQKIDSLDPEADEAGMAL